MIVSATPSSVSRFDGKVFTGASFTGVTVIVTVSLSRSGFVWPAGAAPVFPWSLVAMTSVALLEK